MASKPSKTMPTSTIVKPDQTTQQSDTPTVQPKLGVKPTSPIPIPKNAHTSAAQVSVTDANYVTSASPTARKMFFHETARKCYEEAGEEEQADEGSVTKPRRPTTLPVKPQSVDKPRSVPQTSAAMVGSTYTVTVSSSSGETPTTTTGDKTAEGQLPPENFNTSGRVMRRRVEQGLPCPAITLFAPIGMAEDLTKVQLILCKEIKSEIQEVKSLITSIPHDKIMQNFTELATLLDERMTNLEDQYDELKMVVKQRAIQSYIANPSLLEHWSPHDMVIKYSPWTTVRLVLNKVASENITELFPSDWHPRPTMTTDDEKQYQVLKEMMTHMFQQCGYLPEENIIELSNFQDFLRALQHHIFMGDVSITQLIHFIILMVYMSFCRLNHYTEYMSNRDAVLLKAAIHISLVIIAFKTTFSIQGGHHSINPYMTNLPPIVRRNLHIVNTKYIEQQCTCKNHVQCDINPIPLTTEVVLPSYQHYIDRFNLMGGVSNESRILSDYGKTIQMMILARVNGYYSPFFPSTLGQEEDQAGTKHTFNLAEENFFRHRLTTLYPKIDEEGIKSAIGFLEQQKLVNCPCSIHTEKRGYEWIVFTRQPDRKMVPTDEESDEQSYTESLSDPSDDDVFYNAETENAPPDQEADFPAPTTHDEGVLEQKTSSSEVPESFQTKAQPQMSDQPRDSSLHSRERKGTKVLQKDLKKKRKKGKNERETKRTDEDPMLIDDEEPDEDRIIKKRKGFSYYPLYTYKRKLDKTFYYKYFKPCCHDYRRLRMEEDCTCSETEPHNTNCEWYDPDTIFILDAINDISASEEAALQQIYDLYMASLNSSHPQKEKCGCGTKAEIAYMGHLTSCEEFQYIHERESYEVLLARLKKKKRTSFPGCPFNKKKRPKLQSRYKAPAKEKDEEDEPGKSKMSGKIPDAAKTQSPDPPINPPKSFSTQNPNTKDGFVCSHDTNGDIHGEANGDRNDEPEGQAIDEMPPLEGETEV